MNNKKYEIITIILYVLLIGSIFVIVKFSSLSIPPYFPSFMVEWLQQPNPSTSSYEIYRILEKISVSFITAYLVYVLIDLVPGILAGRKVSLIFHKNIVDIYGRIDFMIGSLKMLIELDKPNEKIDISDLKAITAYNPEYERTYYSRSFILGDNGNRNNSKGIFNYHARLSDEASKINDKIDEIIRLPIALKMNYKLLEIICEIRSSAFLNYCKHLSRSPLIHQVHYVSMLDENLYQFIQLQLELNRHYKFKRKLSLFKKLSQSEITLFDEERQELMKNISYNNAKFFKNGIEYIITNSKLN